MTKKHFELQGWLEEGGCHSVHMVAVTIGSRTWVGARYNQQTNEAIYCVGELPQGYRAGKENKVCYTFEGVDWYIAGYLATPASAEVMKRYHPFGINFILMPWFVGDGKKIDHYEQRPYTRVAMEVKPI